MGEERQSIKEIFVGVKETLDKILKELEFHGKLFSESYMNQEQQAKQKAAMTQAPMTMLKIFVDRLASQVEDPVQKANLKDLVSTFDQFGGSEK